MSFLRAHLEHFLKACRFSLSGLRIAFQDEIAFRQILCWLALAFILSSFLAESWTEFILLILPPCISVMVELLNTAVENVVDLVQPQWHRLAKKAKDTASAAQFFSQLLSAVVWLSFLVHKFMF